MKITNRKLNELVPYVRNARTHSPQQIKQIEASLLEFGWCNPVSIDGKVGIVAGHGRVQAATNLMNSPDAVIPNWPDKTLVPTIDLSHLTPIQRKAYILADNKIALNAGYDSQLLALELMELQEDGFDLPVIGFDTAELDNLFRDNFDGPDDGGLGDGSGSEIEQPQAECQCPKCGFRFDPQATDAD